MIDIEAMRNGEDFRRATPEQQRMLLDAANAENHAGVGLKPGDVTIPGGNAPRALNQQQPPPGWYYPNKSLAGETPSAVPVYPERLPSGWIQHGAMPPIPTVFAHMTPNPEQPPGVMPGLLPGVGQALGQGTAIALAPASAGASIPALAGFGAAGSALGFTLESVLNRGKFPTWKELAVEAAGAAIPEIVAGGIGRTLGAGAREAAFLGKPGRILRRAEQFQMGQDAAMGIFNAPTKEVVDSAYKAVRESGRQVDISELALDIMNRFRPGERRMLANEMGKVDGIINARTGNTQSRQFQELFDRLETIAHPRPAPKSSLIDPVTNQPFTLPEPTPPNAEITLGDIETLRSGIGARLQKLRKNPGRETLILEDFKENLDRAIESQLTSRGNDPAVEQLLKARDAHHRFASAQDLGQFMLEHSKLTRSPTREIWEINLNGVLEDLAKNTKTSAKNLNRHLDAIPGARENWNNFVNDAAQLNRIIEVSMTGTPGIDNIPFMSLVTRGLGESIVAGNASRDIVSRALQHRGQITPSYVAQAVSAARREYAPTEEAAKSFMPHVADQDIVGALRRLLSVPMQGNVPAAE